MVPTLARLSPDLRNQFRRQRALQDPAPSGLLGTSLAPLGPKVVQRKIPCACGGGCPRCRTTSDGLRISQPNDQAEIEADRIADAVMRRTDGGTGYATPAASALRRDGKGDARIQQGPAVPHLASPAGQVATETRGVHEALKSPGQSLPTEIRAYFEPRFGLDLGHVRVHTDRMAQRSAEGVSALAYTVGSHVVFNAGQYAPHSSEGWRLLAHELTHVVQQTADPVTRLGRRTEGAAAPAISTTRGPMIQRNGPAVGEVAPMPTRLVVFVGQATLLRDAPAEGANVLGMLPQGSSVQLISAQGDWYSVEAQVSGASVNGFIKRSEVQSPPSLDGQQVSDPVTNTFAAAVGAQAAMHWVSHPGNPKYEVAVCETGLVSVVYAREAANPAVILQTTMNDATKTPVEQWKPAKTIQCRSAQ